MTRFPVSHINKRTGLVVFVLVFLLALFAPSSQAQDMRLLAGAGLRQPVDYLVDQFSRQNNIKVFVDYAGSGQLLTKYLASKQGDLFLPGALIYIDQLKKRDMVSLVKPIVLHTPVLAVNKSCAKVVQRLNDLTRPGLKVGLGDPKAIALGRQAESILKRAGLAEKIAPNVKVRTATVKQLTLYIAQGYVDAGITARADAFQFRDKINMYPIHRTFYKPDLIAVALLKSTKHKRAAQKLMQHLCSPSAIKVFQNFGFLPMRSNER
jgi:molybdate transport system substrate-binding protein